MSVPRKRRVIYEDNSQGSYWQDGRPVVAVNHGDAVRINMPENSRVHQTLAHVKKLNYYGNDSDQFWALLDAPAAASGQLRALPHEMEPVLDAGREDLMTYPGEGQALVSDSAHGDVPLPSSAKTQKQQARSYGYTGDACPVCGGWQMKRTGTCVTCEQCGHNEGCV